MKAALKVVTMQVIARGRLLMVKSQFWIASKNAIRRHGGGRGEHERSAHNWRRNWLQIQGKKTFAVDIPMGGIQAKPFYLNGQQISSFVWIRCQEWDIQYIFVIECVKSNISLVLTFNNWALCQLLVESCESGNHVRCFSPTLAPSLFFWLEKHQPWHQLRVRLIFIFFYSIEWGEPLKVWWSSKCSSSRSLSQCRWKHGIELSWESQFGTPWLNWAREHDPMVETNIGQSKAKKLQNWKFNWADGNASMLLNVTNSEKKEQEHQLQTERIHRDWNQSHENEEKCSHKKQRHCNVEMK